MQDSYWLLVDSCWYSHRAESIEVKDECSIFNYQYPIFKLVEGERLRFADWIPASAGMTAEEGKLLRDALHEIQDTG